MLEINNNSFNNIQNDLNNQNDLLSLIEQENFERNQAINTLNNFRNKYQNENEDYLTLKDMQQNLYETENKYKIIENKLSENINNLLNTERQLSAANNKNEMLLKENTLIKNQLSQFENVFNNMKKRKQEENDELRKELEEINEEKDELNTEKNNLKFELNEIKSKYKFLQQENDIIKSESENMKRIIRENSDKVKISDEKINSIDNLINLYKKNNEDLNFEIEKLKLEKKAEKEESNRNISEFEITLKEKDEIFEKELEKKRMEYEQNLNEQIEENENLKSKVLEYKMERDKYKGDYEIANDEKKNCLEQIEELKMKFNQMLKENEQYYLNQINQIKQRDRVKIVEENNLFNSDSSFKNNNITNEKLAKNGEEMYIELIKLQKENEELKKENEELKKENERLKSGENNINNFNNDNF